MKVSAKSKKSGRRQGESFDAYLSRVEKMAARAVAGTDERAALAAVEALERIASKSSRPWFDARLGVADVARKYNRRNPDQPRSKKTGRFIPRDPNRDGHGRAITAEQKRRNSVERDSLGRAK